MAARDRAGVAREFGKIRRNDHRRGERPRACKNDQCDPSGQPA
jgi:hypothetical protein